MSGAFPESSYAALARVEHVAGGVDRAVGAVPVHIEGDAVPGLEAIAGVLLVPLVRGPPVVRNARAHVAGVGVVVPLGAVDEVGRVAGPRRATRRAVDTRPLRRGYVQLVGPALDEAAGGGQASAVGGVEALEIVGDRRVHRVHL